MAIVRKVLLENPESKLFTVDVSGTVLDALQVMKSADTGAVLVSDGHKIVGIFTERDYTRNVEVNGREAKNTPVKDLMTKEMVMVKPETSVQQCINLMARYHIRHLPVIENEKVVGVVSLRKLADTLLADHKETIAELENYILGTGFAQ
jgi:CBS domain-containing protein